MLIHVLQNQTLKRCAARATAVAMTLFALDATVAVAQGSGHGGELAVTKVHRQRSFRSTVPAGNYSGIAPLGGDSYAVVCDKSETDGFFVFRIDIDSISGKLRNVACEGFRSSGEANRDQEGIAYVPESGLVYVGGEADNQVFEYDMEGKRTGCRLAIPDIFASASANYGLESLTYNATTHLFWLTSESTLPADGAQATAGNDTTRNLLRIQSFDESLQPRGWHYYMMDAPTAKKRGSNYAMGVSELCALDDGRLLVLEREFYVSRRKLGSFVRCKLFVADPSACGVGEMMPKRLLTEFKTGIRLFNYRLANYEGMCLGPRLADGGQVIVLVSDSQGRYGGVLRDWFKTIVLSDTK